MKLTLKKSFIILASIFLSSQATSSFAQDDLETDASNQSLSSLFACLKIASDSDRLNCQDTEIKKLKSATEAKTVVVFDEKSAKEVKKKSFGFSLPKLGLKAFDNGTDKNNAVILLVKSVDKSGRKLTVIMENGQIWQSLGSDTIYVPRNGKLEARIKAAALGSYTMRLTTDKGRSKKIRVRRIE